MGLVEILDLEHQEDRAEEVQVHQHLVEEFLLLEHREMLILVVEVVVQVALQMQDLLEIQTVEMVDQVLSL